MESAIMNPKPGTLEVKHVDFTGRLVMVGFGSIGQGVLPLILRHIKIKPEQITIFTAHEWGREIAASQGVTDFRLHPLTRENFQETLEPLLGKGDFLLNLSYDVSSPALMELCHTVGALYLDSCIEPWAGGYYDPTLSPTQRSNYGLREEAFAINRRNWPHSPTCVVTHGVNPGLVSHFVKDALMNMAADTGLKVTRPKGREEWAKLAQMLDVKVIHIAERDTQVAAERKKIGEFVNTWSVEAFVGEGSQPAELGWGSHETRLPESGRRHPIGCQAAIYLEQPGVATRVRSWTPLEGPYMGYLITHGESISIADYLTVRDGESVAYRPTVHYAYHPCDDAVLSIHEYCGKGYVLQDNQRLIKEEIVSGMDELGVMIGGNKKGTYWYGSRLTIEQAKALAPHNGATSLQTTAGVLGGMIWALQNPERGVVEPDEMDADFIMSIARPYLGEMVGVWSKWTPLTGREKFFPEKLERNDPWQFANVLVA
jgi:homospermidine synthase